MAIRETLININNRFLGYDSHKGWTATDKLNALAMAIGVDRRCRFRDLGNMAKPDRLPNSPVLQFYSSVDNIGNYLPVLGIHKMLGASLDTWCVHDSDIDFEFINKNYRGIIIGGAGLLYNCFESFWKRCGKECNLPTVIWGVGGCFPDNVRIPLVGRESIGDVLERCDLINVRDDITAEYCGIAKASVTPCPTIAYLEGYSRSPSTSRRVLYACHTEMVNREENKKTIGCLLKAGYDAMYTTNVQVPLFGLNDIIQRLYLKSDIVVASRLHGAITAYGLGIPYIAIARDEKMRAFHRLYGNGQLAEDIETLPECLEAANDEVPQPDYHAVREFGREVLNWMADVTPVFN